MLCTDDYAGAVVDDCGWCGGYGLGRISVPAVYEHGRDGCGLSTGFGILGSADGRD